MSVASIVPASVTYAYFGRPSATASLACHGCVIADGGAFRNFSVTGDAAYRLRSGLLRVTGQSEWPRVLHSPVRAVVVDGEVVAIRSPEDASEDVQLSLDSLVLSVHEVVS